MEAKAVARYVRMSSRKARRTLELIRGLPLKEARSLLDVLPQRAARVVRRVMDSAAANAENNHGMEPDELWVAEAFADEGPTMRRWRFTSGGRAAMIRKRMTHISIVLSDEER
jgi:large subunit ribosomal protein L22